ncbi:MAG: hypothetical protein QOH35_4707 [Acidobacteriaceae bacterium]|nr:hypothetical protein [Acidobacteriaceae bacterium]
MTIRDVLQLVPVDLEHVLPVARNESHFRASVPRLRHSAPVIRELPLGHPDVDQGSLKVSADENLIHGLSAVRPSVLSACAAVPLCVQAAQISRGSVRLSMLSLRRLPRGFFAWHTLTNAIPMNLYRKSRGAAGQFLSMRRCDPLGVGASRSSSSAIAAGAPVWRWSTHCRL